ncbi:MAG: RNA polymerase sigma factor [Candidatus Peregrinibacteria bacterium]|nr:RNA polymerase sigma factor [Candidatus Peregrinibacteria bacterium]
MTEQEFEKCYREYLPKVYRYFVSRTGDRTWAEDLTSQTFLRALEKKHQFDGKNFGGWVFRIGRNILIDEGRKKSHESFPEEMPDIETSENHKAETNEKFVFENLEKIFKKLEFSETDKEIFILKIVGDFKFKEIAKITKIPENTIKTKYFRNLKKVKPHASDLLSIMLLLKLF